MTIFAFAASSFDACACCVDKLRHRTYTDIAPDLITDAQIAEYRRRIQNTPVAGLTTRATGPKRMKALIKHYEKCLPRRLPSDDAATVKCVVGIIGDHNYEIRRFEFELDVEMMNVIATRCTEFDVCASERTHTFLSILESEYGMKYVSPYEVRLFVVAYQCVNCCAGTPHKH